MKEITERLEKIAAIKQLKNSPCVVIYADGSGNVSKSRFSEYSEILHFNARSDILNKLDEYIKANSTVKVILTSRCTAEVLENGVKISGNGSKIIPFEAIKELARAIPDNRIGKMVKVADVLEGEYFRWPGVGFTNVYQRIGSKFKFVDPKPNCPSSTFSISSYRSDTVIILEKP